MSAGATSALVRGIDRWALTAFSINLTVGAGILGLPGRIQALVGQYSVLVIVACGLLLTAIAFCFAELGSRFARSGGPQLFVSLALGPTCGFTVGWLLWLSRLGTCAAVSNLLVDYGSVLWPALSLPAARVAAIAALVIAYTWLNVRGIRQTALVSTLFTVAKLVPLVAFVAVGLFFVDTKSLHLGELPSLHDASSGVILAAFAFFGFDATTVLGGEIRDARRAIPFAILLSMSVVIALYVLIQLVCVGTLPQLATSTRPLADAAVAFVGPRGATLIALVAIVSSAGVFGCSMTAGSRILFATAEQGQTPAVLARLHPRFGTPTVAILVTAGAAFALAASGSFLFLVKVTAITRVTVYAMTCALLPVFRRRDDVPAAAFTVPAGKVVAYGSALLCVLLLVNSSVLELIDVLIATAAGLLLTFVARRISSAGASVAGRT